MALAKDVNLPIADGSYADHPVLNAVKIYEGAIVSITAAGYAKGYAGTDVFFAGIADRQADNSAGAAGDIKVRVRRDIHTRVMDLSGAALADVGDAVYASDDGTLTKTATSNLYVGIIEAFLSTGKVLVRVESQNRIAAAQADSGAAPTQAEFNALLAKLRAAAIMRT